MTVVLLNGQYRPEVDMLGTLYGAALTIDQSASDPVPTCTFTIDDTGSQISVGRLQEVVVIDNDAFANPAQNLLKNPTMNPYNTTWSAVPPAGVTLSQNTGGGVIYTMSNAATPRKIGMSQGIAIGTPTPGLYTVIPGQQYVLSLYAQPTTTSGVSGITLAGFWYDAGGNSIGFFGPTDQAMPDGFSNVRYSQTVTAPAGAAYFLIEFGVALSSSTNSGTMTFTNVQFEPAWFVSAGPTISYPTPFVDVSQANCTALPNGTCVRQQRLFAGLVTHWINGPYAGKNRAIQVTASGPGFLIDSRLVSKSYSSKHDDEIIVDIIATYFSGIFTTNHVHRGVNYASVAYNYDGARTVFDALASTSTWRWFVDPYYDVWFIPDGFYMATYGLSDTPDNSATFVYSEYTSEFDFTQPCNAAYVTVSGGPNFVRTTDAQSVAVVGHTFDRKISDTSITTNAHANQRGQADVLGYGYERVVLHLQVDQRVAQPALSPGTAISFSNSIEGVANQSYLIQKARIIVKGVDQSQMARYLYQLDLGAYQPLVTNLLTRSARAAAQSSSTSLVLVEDHIVIVERVGYQDSISIHN